MRSVSFLGRTVCAIGQGTWKIGDRRASHAAEVATLQRGLDLGLTVIDTAEMYGEGASETLVGEAVRGRRDSAVIVSKVYPHNAGRAPMRRSCEASLRRLGIDRLDGYLLHWQGSVPLAETVDGFERLKADGKIAAWGVSNFDVGDMEDLLAAGGTACATNQILYNLTQRGPEFDLLPWLEGRGIPTMAYSPIEQGRLPRHAVLDDLAAQHGVDVAGILLAFAIRSGDVLAVPKASSLPHVEASRAAADIALSVDDLARLDAAFPPPGRKQPLAML